MGQRWTDEMQADLERWQAIEEEAASPKDFLIPDPSFRDVPRGLVRSRLNPRYRTKRCLAVQTIDMRRGQGR